MKIQIEIFPEYYDRLVSQIPTQSTMYAVLKNGLIIDHSEVGWQRKMIYILCEMEEAKSILHIADKVCLGAAAQIAAGINAASRSSGRPEQ
jgi:hypothetical protein